MKTFLLLAFALVWQTQALAYEVDSSEVEEADCADVDEAQLTHNLSDGSYQLSFADGARYGSRSRGIFDRLFNRCGRPLTPPPPVVIYYPVPATPPAPPVAGAPILSNQTPPPRIPPAPSVYSSGPYGELLHYNPLEELQGDIPAMFGD